MVASEESQLLREINFGIRENLPSHVTSDEAKDIVAAKLGVHRDSVVDHAESSEQIISRQTEFFKSLGSRLSAIPSDECKIFKVLCVSHGGFIRHILNHHCNLGLHSIGNCSINIIELIWDDPADTTAVSIYPIQIEGMSHLDN